MPQKFVEAQGSALNGSPQHQFTYSRQSVLQEETGETFIDSHQSQPLQTYAEADLYGNAILPNVEQDPVSTWTTPLLSGFRAQGEQGDAIQYIHNVSMEPNERSYEGVTQLPSMENSFAMSQPFWTPSDFAPYGEAFLFGNSSGELRNPHGYGHYTSGTIGVPLPSDHFLGTSSALMDYSLDAFRTQALPIFEPSMPSSTRDLLNEVNITESLLGFSGNHEQHHLHSFALEDDNANAKAMGESLGNHPTDGEIDDFSMFWETSTPPERLGPNLAAVLLGIPQDPGMVSIDSKLPFSYEPRLNSNNGDNSIEVTQSPNTLEASDIATSPTLTKVSSLQSSVTMPVMQLKTSHRTESEQQQLEEDESITGHEIYKSYSSSSREFNSGISKPCLHTVLPLLPPPADFSHTNIVVKTPTVHSSAVVEKYLKEASEAKQQGESKLAIALPALTNLPLAASVTSQKRPLDPEEYLTDPSNHDTCRVMEDLEREVNVLLPNAVTTGSEFSRKKRGKLSKQQRVSTATIRKLGACLRCGIYKEKCSDSVPCERCIEVARNKPATINIPCWRSKLGAIELFRRRTQHGLFIYTYTKQFDGLPTRAVQIFDPEILKHSNRQELPFTCQHELMIESLRPLKYLESHLFRDKNGHIPQSACTIQQLEKGKVINTYLDKQIKPVLNALGTSHQFVHLTLDVAEKYSQNPDRKMLRNSLRIFTARFLRRKFWVSTPDEVSYDVAWMDVPWRAMPVVPPNTPAEAETLNKILKDYLFSLEKDIIRDFRAKIYARKREDWFELFLVTFIFQVILSEKLEMSFYSHVSGVASALEMPWSTFGGLRSYSSQAIAAHFRAINGAFPFQMSRRDRIALGKLGDIENNYLDVCPKVLKDAMRKKDDLGSRRSSSSGHGGTPGSWWQWAIETVLNFDAPD